MADPVDMRWSISDVLADIDTGWWDSVLGCAKAESAIRGWRVQLADVRQRGERAERRARAHALMVESDTALAEIKARKQILGNTDNPGNLWKQVVVREIRQRYGDAAFDEINAVARAEVDRLTALRSAPMAAGSVLAPIGTGGGMRTR